MNKNFKNIIVLYIAFIILILSFLLYSTKAIYNNLTIIDSSSFNKKSFSTKFPTKIIIHNDYLGTTISTDNLLMNDTVQYFNDIKSSKMSKENKIKNTNTITISGEIFYSNSTSEKYKVNNHLTIDNKKFYDDSYLINTLRNSLFNNLYTYPNILNILKSNKTKIIYEKENLSYTLNNEKKKKLIECLNKFSTMKDNKDFLNTNLNEDSKGVLKIFINGLNTINANNTIYIAIYKNYLAIQYLGDENGKNIYIKGELNEKDFK